MAAVGLPRNLTFVPDPTDGVPGVNRADFTAASPPKYASIISNKPAVTPGSSVKGPATAARAASRRPRPSATSRPAATSTRVDATSRRPAVSSRRIAWPSCTSCAAVAGSTPDSCATIFSSTSAGREIELDGHHSLARRVLEVLEHALISGVVGDDQAEARGRVERDAQAFDRQLATMVGQRVEHDRCVLAGLDDLVEVADRAFAHGARERPVDPAGVAAVDQDGGRRGQRSSGRRDTPQ